MWHQNRISLTLVLCSFANLAIAETARLDGDFEDDLRSAANTGGARVIGLQVEGPNTNAQLRAMLPAPWDDADQKFCVRTRSSDALYDSENTYFHPDAPDPDAPDADDLSDTQDAPDPEDPSRASLLPVDVPHIDETEYSDNLRAIGSQGFGVRIFLAACNKIEDDTQSTVALWRDGTLAEEVSLLVNSLGAERLVVILSQGDIFADPVDCTPVAADVTVAYDRICQLELTDRSGPAMVELLPFKSGKMLRPEFVPDFAAMSAPETVPIVRGMTRRLMAQAMKNHWLILFGLLPLMIWTVLTLIVPTRTVQLEARTLSAEIQMFGGPQSWKMNGASVCLPAKNLKAPAVLPCGDGQELRAADLDEIDVVDWPTGQKLQLIWAPSGLRIILKSDAAFQFADNETWPQWTELRLSLDQALENGALFFSGRVVIGEQMRAGATGYILDGSYLIFERGLPSALLDLSPDITRSGDLRRGDEIEIICRSSLLHTCAGTALPDDKGRHVNRVSGAISMDNDGAPGMHVVGLSEEANSMIKVASAGRDVALEVKPGWLQRAALSSSLLAISVILALWAPILLAVLDRYKRV